MPTPRPTPTANPTSHASGRGRPSVFHRESPQNQTVSDRSNSSQSAIPSEASAATIQTPPLVSPANGNLLAQPSSSQPLTISQQPPQLQFNPAQGMVPFQNPMMTQFAQMQQLQNMFFSMQQQLGGMVQQPFPQQSMAMDPYNPLILTLIDTMRHRGFDLSSVTGQGPAVDNALPQMPFVPQSQPNPISSVMSQAQQSASAASSSTSTTIPGAAQGWPSAIPPASPPPPSQTKPLPTYDERSISPSTPPSRKKGKGKARVKDEPRSSPDITLDNYYASPSSTSWEMIARTPSDLTQPQGSPREVGQIFADEQEGSLSFFVQIDLKKRVEVVMKIKVSC